MQNKPSLTATLLAALGLGVVLGNLPSFAENMDPDHDNSKYGWGENVGWINLEPSGDGGPGVQVDDFLVTGWMWGENIGWISLSCRNRGTCDSVSYGVRNDGLGNLSGEGWTENTGWIRFSHSQGGVWVDPADGVFHGYAWGENVGWIQMGTVSGPFPYRIRTAWSCVPAPPVPAEALELRLARLGVVAELGWNPVAGATGYDVVYGDLTILRSPPGGDFAAAAIGCIGENATDLVVAHSEPAPVDHGFWYLARPANCGGAGSYDSDGGGQTAPRDAELAASGGDCVTP